MSHPPDRAAERLATAIERHRAALWRYLRVLGADDATADDLVQEAFVVALQRPGFDASTPAATFAFLRTTARHRWLKSQRRRVTRREVAHADELWQQQCGDDGVDDYLEALRACVDELPARSRGLLEATYRDGAGRRA
ncbi:MAG: hypothetical protein KAI24_22995, partial [Planctomycetes bacterium]|nr:hypothetical protein [Planctomycetota bacterium]